MRRKWVFGLMVVCVLLPVAGAMGQEKPGAKMPVSRLSARAIDFISNGKFQEAIDIWRGLLPRLEPDVLPLIHKNIGRAYHRTERPALAWHHYQRALEGKKGDAQLKRWAGKAEEELRRSGKCVVEIRVKPAPDTLEVDETAVDLPREKVRWWFDKTSHTAAAERKGFEPGSARFNVDCRKGATVKLELKQKKPVVVKPLPPVDNKPGPSVAAPVDSRQDRTWEYVMLGGGVACLLGGTGTFLMALSNQDDLDADFDRKYPGGVFPDDETAKQAENDYDTRQDKEVQAWATTSWILWGIGGAAVVTSAALLFLDQGPASDSSATIFPMVSPGAAGFGLSVGF